jgi:hypothetical protein
LSLRAPIAVPIEVRAPSGRVFRLAWNVGEDGARLASPAPFEPGRPVEVRLALPEGDGAALALRAELRPGGADADDPEQAVELAFVDPPEAARAALRRYVHARLGLPG